MLFFCAIVITATIVYIQFRVWDTYPENHRKTTYAGRVRKGKKKCRIGKMQQGIEFLAIVEKRSPYFERLWMISYLVTIW